MMLLLITAAASLTPDQQAIVSYQGCLTPIVAQNERRPASSYIRFESLFQQVKEECAVERRSARDALSATIMANHPDHPRQPTEAEKEDLINEATIRWMNSVVHRVAAAENN